MLVKELGACADYPNGWIYDTLQCEREEEGETHRSKGAASVEVGSDGLEAEQVLSEGLGYTGSHHPASQGLLELAIRLSDPIQLHNTSQPPKPIHHPELIQQQGSTQQEDQISPVPPLLQLDPTPSLPPSPQPPTTVLLPLPPPMLCAPQPLSLERFSKALLSRSYSVASASQYAGGGAAGIVLCPLQNTLCGSPWHSPWSAFTAVS